MTTTPPTPAPELDFSLLSAGLGIVSTSPAWPEVEAALGRLEAGAGASDAERKADVALVQAFARKLEREANTVGRALVAAAAIGALVPGERRERVWRGLEVLSAGYDLRRLRPAEVTAVLKQLMRAIVDGYDPPQLTGSYTLRKPRTPGQWRTLVSEDSHAVETAVQAKGIDTVLVWTQWVGYLPGALIKPDFYAPELSMLICAAARIGPGEWLRIDPRSMTMREWSIVLRGALHAGLVSTDAPPAWAGTAALWVLGFPALDVAEVRGPTTKGTTAPAEEAVDYGLALRRVLTNRTPRAAAVIVTAPDSEFLTAWHPAAPDLAALMLTPRELSDLASSAPDLFKELASRVPGLYLVVEVDADGAEPPGLARSLRGPLGQLPRVDLYRALPRVTPKHHLVVAPANPAEFLQGLLTQAQR